MAVVIRSTSTLYRPTAIGLRSTNRGDYRSKVRVSNRYEWTPMAARLDWDTVRDLDEFHVRACFAEYEETRKESKYDNYNGRPDARRVPDGKRVGRTVCKVIHGEGDHTVYMKNSAGVVSKRIVPEAQVIQTARLFLSVAYLRRELRLRIGADVWLDAPCMIIKPV